jgi:hypothetical protein
MPLVSFWHVPLGWALASVSSVISPVCSGVSSASVFLAGLLFFFFGFVFLLSSFLVCSVLWFPVFSSAFPVFVAGSCSFLGLLFSFFCAGLVSLPFGVVAVSRFLPVSSFLSAPSSCVCRGCFFPQGVVFGGGRPGLSPLNSLGFGGGKTSVFPLLWSGCLCLPLLVGVRAWVPFSASGLWLFCLVPLTSAFSPLHVAEFPCRWFLCLAPLGFLGPFSFPVSQLPLGCRGFQYICRLISSLGA